MKKFDEDKVSIKINYRTESERYWIRETIKLARVYRLKFNLNPGGGSYYRDDWGQCQLYMYNPEEDYQILKQWIGEKTE